MSNQDKNQTKYIIRKQFLMETLRMAAYEYAMSRKDHGGMGVSVCGSEGEAQEHRDKYGGQIFKVENWSQVKRAIGHVIAVGRTMEVIFYI